MTTRGSLKPGKPIEVCISDRVSVPLMVCSHERSGTHFLMNYLATCTNYSNDPHLNYDIIPLGSKLNFFSERSVENFFRSISSLNREGRTHCVSSIVKSHYPISLLRNCLNDTLKVAYIYRNPADVMISYWKFLHRWDWFEGPKTETPLMLAKHVPTGQSQRYQLMGCGTYLERWARHVSDASAISGSSPNLVMANYDKLKNDSGQEIESICKNLGIDLTGEATLPPRKQATSRDLT